MTFSGSLMGMGNPLLDISADVGQDILDKYDVKMDNAILAEEKHVPLYKELVENYSPQYIAWSDAKLHPCRTMDVDC